jgi:nitrate/nitrite transport system permease protein
MSSASLAANAAADLRASGPARITPIRPVDETAAATAAERDAEAVAADRRRRKEAQRLARREALRTIAVAVLPPLLGFALFLFIWTLVSRSSPQLPPPIKVWHSAVNLFADPFYRKGPNDQGIGWNILNSLQRVGWASV